MKCQSYRINLDPTETRDHPILVHLPLPLPDTTTVQYEVYTKEHCVCRF